MHNEVEDSSVPDFKQRGRKSLLSIGGIAKGRKIGSGDVREYTKKAVARKIAREGR